MRNSAAGSTYLLSLEEKGENCCHRDTTSLSATESLLIPFQTEVPPLSSPILQTPWLSPSPPHNTIQAHLITIINSIHSRRGCLCRKESKEGADRANEAKLLVHQAQLGNSWAIPTGLRPAALTQGLFESQQLLSVACLSCLVSVSFLQYWSHLCSSLTKFCFLLSWFHPGQGKLFLQ